ncbi:septum formation family protein [Corynebacterium sp. 320]|uniref:Septum formation family protein n=1 Tax=Corynebacterium zhongnanshanii TaxID=2768834 RepID=A0ABQ6VEE4_9CORY|nr:MULTISPECIES: septum formation family protein [Corynebacterium]KAB1504346.1 septum formation family protein [Corynebacterium sp. 320]KAB1552554.1 septum formation family protein [Corynebacterium sp. 321]KAB3522794.1 septum formation family protein [Corynebacterium zhongnanshanii]KAB3528482.1 septum formation family protein [Corynebacterium sp. 250]MCR5914142.1 hypothetical protein [Corynebacterium sp. zg254]
MTSDHRKPSTSSKSSSSEKTKIFLIVVLVLALCGGVAAAAYGFMSPDGSNPLSPANEEQKKQEAEFTNANTGSCITWTPANNGTNTNFTTVDCAQPHRFEVSAREDLSQYPTSEFGEDSAIPNLERQQQLTSQLCVGPTMSYLNGKLDPEGRYTISPILPPANSWDAGDRTMLCGVMVQDAQGRSVETTGLAAEQDQSAALPADTCVRADGDATVEVPCDQDHSWQVVSVVNLAEKFPDAWPTPEQQNEHLNEVCTEAARAYLGGDDQLYESTLTPFWTTLKQQSWDAGSRNVNCAVTFGHPGGGFAVLNGDVRQGFTIDGAAPEKRQKRPPLKNAPAAQPAP